MIVMLYSTIVWLFVVVSGEPQLKHIQILFRHGDRSPTKIYPTDINRASKWPRGLGQLTTRGIQEHFHLGIWLRKRYSSFFGPILNNSDIHVRSTDTDRTLMSGESNLAGFVFNEVHQVIPELSWRPVAIHTVREDVDYLLAFSICPRYNKERIDLYDLDYFKKQFDPYRSLLKHISKETGVPDLKFIDFWEIYDAIFCEKTHNMTVNDWVTDDIWKKLQVVNKINWELMFYKDLAKLSAGLLLYTITNRMINVTTNDRSHKDGFKYVIYSGHDTDVAPIAQLLGFYYNIQSPYAASVIFELYHDSNASEQWSVKVLYKNDSASIGPGNVHAHIVPGCPDILCPLSRFIEVTKDKVLTKAEFLRECGLASNILLYVKIVFGGIAAAVVLVICALWLVKRHRQKMGPRYSRFNGEKCVN